MDFSTAWRSWTPELRGMVHEEDFVKWLQPLLPEGTMDNPILLAPNQYVKAEVEEKFLGVIEKKFNKTMLSVDNREPASATGNKSGGKRIFAYSLNKEFTFDNFVEGRDNQLAKASAMQVSSNLGKTYNPLFIHGGAGLGKTHLMQSIGNSVISKDPRAEVAYVHCERFVAEYVAAVAAQGNNSMDNFKKKYRSADVLLIDDVQFFIGKERSQEEFFHTFNSLVENDRQVVITSDRYPNELKGNKGKGNKGIEERLASRFNSGLTVTIGVPDLETRVAIIKNKSKILGIEIPDDVCFFIARNFKANVRELQGALNRLRANHQFSKEEISLEFTRNSLKDLLNVSNKQITIEYIQKTVAEYFGIRASDLQSKSRKRRVTRPRQMAMCLTKALTSNSLPDIGDAFGGRDHTTVIHACERIGDLCASNEGIEKDYKSLYKTISS